ncbi:TPA: MFS transporter [Providencia stuartii]|uniref:MFS transporter n=4 Tax=Providencia stuartii TaxID=588 RepID=A0AAJ1JDJ5_PROST|nr:MULTISPECIES: MFS transporter [Providencia]SST01224.1 putative transport protein (permease) [Acinetobacter baumannii]AFH95940.1 major facilitator superfamily protein [Providencia stuartii MRSN 2154]AIN63752.1 major Facilitator Superfamily protein [Providencia stuartii]APG49925.1 MFS transporter [Providencia stuartii]EDU59402.1 transporter, major facilitator family protein [Providencia stuartii ATCC 25827]
MTLSPELLETTPTTPPAKKEQVATRIIFFIAGFATASWAAIVPFVKANTGANDATLGLLLLCFGVGALIAMPLTGAIAAKFGCRKLMVASTIAFCLLLPLLPAISHIGILIVGLLLFGVGIGLTDCAMNIQAVIVDKASEKPIISGFHGYYSVGGIVGAGAMSAILLMGTPPIAAAIIISLVSLLLLSISFKGFLSYANAPTGPLIAIPKGIVLVIGIICFAIFLAEGTVLDWSAVFLIEHHGLEESLGGLGFAAFATTMTIGRLTGDKIVMRVGSARVVFWGALLACIGFMIAVLSPYLSIAIIGYALVGAGCSNIVPVMFSSIGKQNTMPEALAVPAVSTLGYLGILAGPAAIGFVAFQFTLATALLTIAALLVIIAFVSKLVRV